MKSILVRTGKTTLQIIDLLIVATIAYLSLLVLNKNDLTSSELLLSAWFAILFDSVLLLIFFTAWSLSPISSMMKAGPFFSRERLFSMPFSLLITALVLAAARALGLIHENTGIIVLLLILAVAVPIESLLEKSIAGVNKNLINRLLEVCMISVFFLSVSSIWVILMIGRLSFYDLISAPEWLESAATFILNNFLEWLEENA